MYLDLDFPTECSSRFRRKTSVQVLKMGSHLAGPYEVGGK